MRLWIVQYRCGCTDGPKPRKELLEYCGKHGDNAQDWIKLPSEKELKVLKELKK